MLELLIKLNKRRLSIMWYGIGIGIVLKIVGVLWVVGLATLFYFIGKFWINDELGVFEYTNKSKMSKFVRACPDWLVLATISLLVIIAWFPCLIVGIVYGIIYGMRCHKRLGKRLNKIESTKST